MKVTTNFVRVDNGENRLDLMEDIYVEFIGINHHFKQTINIPQ